MFLIIERKKEEEEKEKVMNVGMDEGGGFVGQFIFCKKKKIKNGRWLCVFLFEVDDWDGGRRGTLILLLLLLLLLCVSVLVC